MAKKQKLIDTVIKERREVVEYDFKCQIHRRLKSIIGFQRTILEAEKGIKLMKKELKELELEPFDESILKEEEG